jgi:hypothetical protein
MGRRRGSELGWVFEMRDSADESPADHDANDMDWRDSEGVERHRAADAELVALLGRQGL